MPSNDPAGSQPSNPPIPEQPTPPQQPVGSQPAAGDSGGPRAWLQRWRRITQPTPPDNDARHPTSQDRKSLLSRSPLNIGFFLTAGALIAYGLVQMITSLQSVVLMVMLSLVIALGLNPAVEWFHRRGIRRGLCVLIVGLLVMFFVGLAFWAVLPPAIEQVTLLFQNLPKFVNDLLNNPQIYAFNQETGIITQIVGMLKSSDFISELVNWAFGGVVGATAFITNLVFSTILTIVLTIYFLATLPTIKEVFSTLSPASRRPRVKYLVNEILKRIGNYVSGLFLVVLMAATYTAIVISIIGFNNGMRNYALALAAVIMLLYFVPLVGSTLAIITISIVGFSYSPLTGVLCLILLFGYQQFDAYFIEPRIYSKSVQVPSIAIILGAISGGSVAGMMGAILAVPVMAALLLLYREVLIPHLDRV
jgi:predicted PurR-regulated permease PerM